jgi:ABC-type cobalt transport system substrate-binding protein
MKRQKLFRWVMITLVLLAMVAPASVSAKAVKTSFEGESETLVDVPDWGEWWESGGMVHVRGMVQVFDCVSSDPRLTGTKTVTINGNWGADGGPWWATSRLETAYGFWEATGTGWYYPDGKISVNEKGHGTSGEVEGLLYFVAADPGELGSGYILDPHSE